MSDDEYRLCCICGHILDSSETYMCRFCLHDTNEEGRAMSYGVRDTQFKNYARLVFEDVEDLFLKRASATDEAEKAKLAHYIQLFIARRMHDLACHVSEALIGDDIYTVLRVSDYPEIPAWQGGQQQP